MTIRIGINAGARRERLSKAVAVARDRRIAAGFMFEGHKFQCDPVSLARISRAASRAGFARGAGARPGDLRWNGALDDFYWLSLENVALPMDAKTCIEFGLAADEHERANIFAARAIKDLARIPADFDRDDLWAAPGLTFRGI